MPSADEIRDAQRATWASCSAGWAKWDHVIVEQLGPVGAAIIGSLGIAENHHHARRADAAGVDNVETMVCRADDLPFADATFDSVSVRFGYMFFPDVARATAEFARVLEPGGRLGASVWVALTAGPVLTSTALQAIDWAESTVSRRERDAGMDLHDMCGATG